MADQSDLMLQILSAAASDLNASGRSCDRVELIAGNGVAWDDCCEGLLYLRTVEIYPSGGHDGTFPQLDIVQKGINTLCSIPLLAYHLAIGVVRCAASVDSQGNPPAAVDVTQNGLDQGADIDTVLQTIMCTIPHLGNIQALKLEKWTPAPTEGGCVGGEWTFYIGLDPCVSCEPE